MYILFAMITASIVYVKSFKDSFTKEHIDKVAPVLLASAVGILLLGIVSSLLSH